MISMYYLLKPGTMAFEFLSIFIVLTVSEGVKMHLRTPVEALCILCGNSKRAVTVKTSWLQKTCHPYREADATSSEIQLPTCYQPADSARTHILLRQD
jgi:hypothetical protein